VLPPCPSSLDTQRTLAGCLGLALLRGLSTLSSGAAMPPPPAAAAAAAAAAAISAGDSAIGAGDSAGGGLVLHSNSSSGGAVHGEHSGSRDAACQTSTAGQLDGLNRRLLLLEDSYLSKVCRCHV
jgi:membrane protein involved in colicin uptake